MVGIIAKNFIDDGLFVADEILIRIIENNLENSVTEGEHTPKLFSDDNIYESEEEDIQNEKLFDQSSTDDEDFEIPAFLRKQKF